LGQARLGKADDFRAFDDEKLFQVRASEMLHHRIMRKVVEDLFADVFRGVLGDQNKVQNAFAASQCLAANQQLAQLQNEREETFDGFGWGWVVQSTPVAGTVRGATNHERSVFRQNHSGPARAGDTAPRRP